MGRNKCSTPTVCAHSHFTWAERLRLQGWWRGTKSEGRIRNRRVLGQLPHKSERTIRRELARGWVKHDRGNPPFEVWEYNAQYAHERATEAHGSKGPQYKIGYDRTLCRAIGALVKEGYSLYAILARFDRHGWPTDTRICEKTTYKYIREGLMEGVGEKDLAREGGRRKGAGPAKRHSHADNAARSIEYRPREAQGRLLAGHWEGDTVVSGAGKGGGLLTLTERKSRYEIIRPLADRSAASVLKALFRTITFDNGSEFSKARAMEGSSLTRGDRTRVFYAHPYRSSERGTNENHNAIVRRFFPKGCALGNMVRTKARRAQDWMNTCPRRILDKLCPFEALARDFKDDARILSFIRPGTCLMEC